jgi:uncharacterized protein (TIGR02246 family)
MRMAMLEDDVRALYQRILDAWNARSASDFAAQFVDDGHIVGFDGSQSDSAHQIEAHLAEVFGSHQTARYVARVRGVQPIADTAAVLRAVVGMVPPGQSDINPAVNAIQTLVAAHVGGIWRALLLQSTPAAFHGRPELVEALTQELRQFFSEPARGQ